MLAGTVADVVDDLRAWLGLETESPAEIGVPVFQTPQEAMDWIKSQWLAQYAYLEDVDMRITQELVRALQDMRNRYPNFALKAIGTSNTVPTNAFAMLRKGENLLLNPKWAKDYGALEAALKETVQAGWAPPGCGSVKAMVDHELLHNAHIQLGLDANAELHDLYSAALAANAMPSAYAALSYDEFLAECWRSYVNAQNPGSTAVRVGEILAGLLLGG